MSRQTTLFDMPAESYDPAHRTRTAASRNDYEGFVDKFKPRLTTDDCYTPEPVIDAVTAFARTLPMWPDGGTAVRPFWPGADYAARDYAPGEVVVDNPPFSILSDIINILSGRGVPFFLFAPHLTCFNYLRYTGITVMPMSSDIVYANGAKVFLSTRPRGARPLILLIAIGLMIVSIHAPAGGATYCRWDSNQYHYRFYPRARGGRD